LRFRTRGKILADSAYPAKLAFAIVNNTDIQKLNPSGEAYAISERVSNDLACKSLHISELITMLGYTKTDISKILQAAKNKELDCALVGLGGTGSNFLHWVYEMSQWTGKTQIFGNILAFDDDIFDVPNMLRIPFLPMLNNIGVEPLKTNCIPEKCWTISRNYILRDRFMDPGDLAQHMLGVSKRTFIYGAPDIETRTWLSEGNYTFFAATHRDGEYSIVENPDVDNDLMMETYGKINLSKFFLNHLSMTIDFLKYIGGTRTEYETQNSNVEIVRKDFNAQFENQLRSGFKAGAKKLFVLNNDNTIINIELEEA
jgi:hypothetical protein